ncbi:MAG: phosphoribosylformylglycinamidine synthase subunit PurL [Methanomassiliicoccaceae archaeon]|nr:phosphoribosylformylglycinamidine synthase subunit PurL [Methanomassiliicoccaceae archaeon]
MKMAELHSALGLTDLEYKEIVKQIGRVPNDIETYLFSAMWSEHCGYSHSRKYLTRFPKEGSLHSEENAGGVQIGDMVIFFKAESHNHPSAVEPFHGAATGIGGIIRDVLALGARPVALLDSLKFGRIDGGRNSNRSKHLFSGVVKGISAYGNSIGVPTVGGEVGFDACYETSPLVNVMAVGIARKKDIKTSSAPAGGHVVIVGSHTGRDGIHGASFASKELSESSRDDRPSVQIGDPFIEKVLIEATLEILGLDEVLACQDCGAAGLLSSTSEMAYKGGCGMELYLDRVHLREDGMEPWEIMLSESQERMIFVTTAAGVRKVLDIADKYEIPANEIGRTVPEPEYRLFMHGVMVANVPPSALNNGVLYDLSETEPRYISEYRNRTPDRTMSVEEAVRKVAGDPNFASKSWIYTQYDHTVGGRTAVTPGKAGAAGIWLPEEGGVLGLTMDSNGRQVFLDPYNGSRNTVYESWRNLVSSGYRPLGVTDCLNYGNPEKKEVGYQLIRSIDGLADGCRELTIPVVSGNVSLYNECEDIRVYPTPTVGMVGYAESAKDLLRSCFGGGETLYLLGREMRQDSHVGASLYQMACFDFLGGEVDKADARLEHLLAETIFCLRDRGLICGAADVSEGGLLGAVLEGSFLGDSGFTGDLIGTVEPLKALFGEITGRYVVSTADPAEFERHCKAPYKRLGKCGGSDITFNGFSFDLEELKHLYENSIEEEIGN